MVIARNGEFMLLNIFKKKNKTNGKVPIECLFMPIICCSE